MLISQSIFSLGSHNKHYKNLCRTFKHLEVEKAIDRKFSARLFFHFNSKNSFSLKSYWEPKLQVINKSPILIHMAFRWKSLKLKFIFIHSLLISVKTNNHCCRLFMRFTARVVYLFHQIGRAGIRKLTKFTLFAEIF